MPLLQVNDLSLRFGGINALNGISFSIEKSRIAAIIGPNGAGKTSLFNCVTGFYRPTSGVILLNRGHEDLQLQQMSQPKIAAKARIARSFQNIRLFGAMTCLENLLVAQYIHRAPSAVSCLFNLPRARAKERETVARARDLLERFGLLGFADQVARTLPYGAQRRLEIARALATGPVLLCLDEPAAGLNETESHELAERLSTLRDDGLTLLLIDHDMGLIMKIADQVIVLDGGRKIADGRPADIRADRRVVAAYLGEELS